MNALIIFLMIILGIIVFAFCSMVYFLERILSRISEMTKLMEDNNERRNS